ncbi:MAG: DUF4142 domain-containing protein [Leptolyngbyaceae cyanobacterium bins.349]|nr:DUF4142 domain-containing protein [Leptolyngbyaceae cyanobacterium bins.349]
MLKRVAVTLALAVFGLFIALGSSVVAQSNVTQPNVAQTEMAQTEMAQTEMAQTNTAQTNIAQTNRPVVVSPTNSQLNEIDRAYMMTAAEAGIANIQMGQLALQRATSSQVKQFAQAEINEQQAVSTELKRIAPQVQVSLPTAPSPKYQAALRQLSRLSGQQFDQAYLSEGGVNAHLENAATFQREAAFGQNPDLVRLANSGLPIINQHFAAASSLTNYRFAQVPQRFNGTGTPASQNPQTTTPRPAQ